MKRRQRTIQEDTLLVGIDIGMERNTAYCTNMSGNGTKTIIFTHTREGYEKLMEYMLMMQRKLGCTGCLVGYEPTGPYGEPLIHYLIHKGVPLVQINPMHTKRLKELGDNSPLKTDKKDSRVITDIKRLGYTLNVVVPEGDAAELRRLMNLRDRHIDERVALMNYLRQLIFLIFPEFFQAIKSLRSTTAMMIVREYLATGSLWKTDHESLGRAIRTTSMGKLGHGEAMRLLHAAHTSIGITKGVSGIMMDMSHVALQIAMIHSLIQEAEHCIEKILKNIPSARYIRSIPGIGSITTAGIIGEIGDFNKFRTQGEVVKFSGLNIYEVSSGKHTGKRKISKRGRSRIRNLLYLAALGTVKKQGIMHAYYTRLLGNSLHKTSALVAVARKLLKIIHAVVRDECMYVREEKEVEQKAA